MDLLFYVKSMLNQQNSFPGFQRTQKLCLTPPELRDIDVRKNRDFFSVSWDPDHELFEQTLK